MQKKKLLIVEDHPLVRRGIVSLIQDSPDYEVLGEATTVAEARLWLGRSDFQIMILDISLPDGLGLDLISLFKRFRPEVKIVILTMHKETPYLQIALQNGASGYVLKDMAAEKLLLTLRNLDNEDGFLLDEIRAMNLSIEDAKRTFMDGLATLSERERTVLRQIKQGQTLTEIAKGLDISVKSVFTYRLRLMRKLGISDPENLPKMTEAVAEI